MADRIDPAETQDNDWSGTAAAEPTLTTGPSLGDLLMLGPDWHPVGVSISYEYGIHVEVFAIPRTDLGEPDAQITCFEITLGEDGAPSLEEVLKGFDRLSVVVTDRPGAEISARQTWSPAGWQTPE